MNKSSLCCNGAALTCMYPTNFPNYGDPIGDSIGYQCVEEHEKSHEPDRVCNASDCNNNENVGFLASGF